MAVTAVSDLNSLYANIYERAYITARQDSLMPALVNNKSAMGWMTRTTKNRPQISAVSVNETQDFASPTTFGASSNAVFTPGEIIAQVVLTDRDVETDPDGAVEDASTELAAAISTKIDTDLCSTFSSFSTDKGDGANATFTFENFAAGISVLRYNKAEKFGGISAVLHDYHWHDLWLELGKPAATYANLGEITVAALRDYYMNTLLGNVRVYTNSNIAVDASSDAISGAFARPAILFDVRRPLRSESQRDASARATELNVTAGYAYGVDRGTLGVKYTADATEPA